MRTNAKARTQLKKPIASLVHDTDELAQEALLIRNLDKDVLLTELITKETILIAASSSVYQNLSDQLKKVILPKVSMFLPPDEMPLLYLSEGKLSSLEDSILFFPSLFRLTKSIVVSEPLTLASIAGASAPGMDVTSSVQLSLRKGQKTN